MSLQYRLTDDRGSVIGAQPGDKSVALDYKQKTRALVVEVFTSHGWPPVNDGHDLEPEIISARTLAKLEDLQSALEMCRYWMDIQRPTGADAETWGRVIADADAALGE